MDGARFYSILLLTALLLQFFAHPVMSDDEDHLLQGINAYRQSLKLPPLSKHDAAGCIADEIADEFEHTKCNASLSPARPEPLANHADALNKCKVNADTTGDAVVLPVCVPHRVATLVLTNYTTSFNTRYLNDSRFTGAGIGTDDDWTVLVLTTSTVAGSITSSAAPVLGGLQVAAATLLLPLMTWM
ncbi:hypothetical protein M569_13106 [Genlisea aurea]|uniref:Uncharacterized GPI-anchored protein At5g19230-like domain-containing protein n=1 Tax=Genlisea aurea TaxID=192259 RepID=S8C478_9LAMI|nr:hypothetical protein M569_13106 [Genlisea aurea]